ncbi:DUF2953 domain-containing protein [Clostridium sp. CS001]|uniref:DUF2953 domain-containing protein n=1 Tax=Clostridium sp. CS001 TaxID=2880648 RepID=UPI001CF2E7B6|nr:DUF2953 domain-containing protein [Clostridium sp. CS001]MCB2288442.1 DUF2953 domain-containing protein [Clostridium sp. CS001]
MFITIIVFLFTLTIILFPIPLKITLKYSNKTLGVFIYNKKLKKKELSKDAIKNLPEKKLYSHLELKDMKQILNKIKKLKLKLTLSLNTKLEYGFDDAAFVAILFGLIHSSYSFLYSLLMNYIEVKKFNLVVIPHFEESDFNMEILGIIYMNLVKIIYMAFIILICLIKIKHKKTNLKKYKGGNVNG